MRNKVKFVLILFIGLSLRAFSQQPIDSVLSSIGRNNKTILAAQQYWTAKKLEFKTGLYPQNPMVEYDYLIGKPATAGNQTDFSVTQSLDFPTAYFKKHTLSNIQVKQGEQSFIIQRRDILLDAKLSCIHLIYLNKRQTELKKRIKDSEKLFQDYKKKLATGEGNLLDVNKSNLQFLNLQNELRQSVSEINIVTQKLMALNGGNVVSITDTTYPLILAIPEFEKLENIIESTDPTLISLQRQKEINEKQVEISRALSFPKIETGYHSQAILGQQFTGAHFGITIPLWQNKNTVKLQKANVLFSGLQLEEHKTEHYYEIKQLYEKYQNLKITLKDYKEVLGSVNNITLLNKALALGQISTIEYYMESTYFFSAYDKYLSLENDYHETIARLYKFTL